jgi:hypothetical protein
VVTGGTGVVDNGLRINAELVERAAGQSVAGGGGPRGGACGGSTGGDLKVEARSGGRWCQLRVQEVAVSHLVLRPN